jgi:hypothetical protein
MGAMLADSYSGITLGFLTLGRCTLAVASFLFIREATGSWIPFPFASPHVPLNLPEGRRDYGAACGLPLPLAEVHLMYSAVALALWPLLQWTVDMPDGAAAGVAVVTIGVGASLRMMVAVLLVYASSESALENLRPGEENMARLLDSTLENEGLFGQEGGEGAQTQQSACQQERKYTKAVATMSWLLAPTLLPRCGTLCAWRCSGPAWKCLTAPQRPAMHPNVTHAVCPLAHGSPHVTNSLSIEYTIHTSIQHTATQARSPGIGTGKLPAEHLRVLS